MRRKTDFFSNFCDTILLISVVDLDPSLQQAFPQVSLIENYINNVAEYHPLNLLVTNHYYQKGNPADINNELKNKYKLLKEFTIDGITFNSIYKIR